MRKIIIGIVVILLVIGGYVFIKNQQIKKELSKVQESQFVNQNSATSSVQAAGTVSAIKSNDIWNITATGAYTIKPESLIFQFTGYKPGGQHIGTFTSIKADVQLDIEGNPVYAKFVFDPKTVKTDTEAVDKHLQAAEFFDTELYPEIVAEVKEFKKEGDSVRAITDLTMKGITRTLSIPVTITKEDVGIKFSLDTRIKISDFNVAYGPVQDETRVTAQGLILKK